MNETNMRSHVERVVAELKEFQLIAGVALLVASIACLSQMLSIPQLDAPLTTAAFCFAIAVPSLCAWVSGIKAKEFTGFSTSSENLFIAVGISGIFSGLAGLTSVFWHFGWYIAVVFIVFTLASFIAFSKGLFVRVWRRSK